MIHIDIKKNWKNCILYECVDELGMSRVIETEVKHHCTYSVIIQMQ